MIRHDEHGTREGLYTRHGHCRGNGGRGTRTYKKWAGMKARCNCRRPQDKDYARYTARGIKVCERWASFENFFSDMGECPEGMTLERIDNSKGYSPENCRWATWTEQQRNRRDTVFLTAFGESRCLSEWACDPRCAVRAGTLWYRINCGWDHETAITRQPDSRVRYEHI